MAGGLVGPSDADSPLPGFCGVSWSAPHHDNPSVLDEPGLAKWTPLLLMGRSPMTQRENVLKPRMAINFIGACTVVFGLGGIPLNTDMPNAQAGGGGNPIQPASKHTNADISFSSPKRYVVIADREKKIKRMYAKGSLFFQEKSWTPVLIIERIEPQGVLIRQTKTDRKELLPFGRHLPGFPHLTLVEEVAVTEIRYGFKVVDDQPDQEPTLKLIEGSRAYLLKEVLKESLIT